MRRQLRHLSWTILLALVGCLGAESLWQAETLADGNLYSDQVARRSGDLITIVVRETTQVREEQKTELDRQSDVDLGFNVVPFSNQVAGSSGESQVGRLPAFRFGSSKAFEGEGTYNASGDVRATITGRVLDVLDNGNMLIEGRRSITLNDDTKTILITGIIRPADVSPGNTVPSEKMHNFQVAIEGEGPLTRQQQEGWLSRLLDVLWPL